MPNAQHAVVISSPSILKTPKNTEEVVDPLDSRYFFFFLSSLPHIFPYTNLFPTMVGDIFSRCVQHTGLRCAILSISSLMADYRLRRSLERFQMHYILTLQRIQDAIQTAVVDEGVGIAIFLILWIDVIRADLEASRKHLAGLHLVLKKLQPGFPKAASERSRIASPLMMQIWRLTVRLDWTASLYLVEAPVFPVIRGEEDFHQQWIRMSVPAGDISEWALAAFELDNLIHAACHLAYQVRTIRRSPKRSEEADRRVFSAVARLEANIRGWINRPVICAARFIEQTAQNENSSDLSQFGSFLNYPALKIRNSFFANLLNSWRAVTIYVSLIVNPMIGQPEPRLFDLAVEICRTIAALGQDRSFTASSKVSIMFLAGVVFGGRWRSPMEAEWISRQVNEIVTMFPFMKDAILSYQKLWDTEGEFWDEMEKTRVYIGKAW